MQRKRLEHPHYHNCPETQQRCPTELPRSEHGAQGTVPARSLLERQRTERPQEKEESPRGVHKKRQGRSVPPGNLALETELGGPQGRNEPPSLRECTEEERHQRTRSGGASQEDGLQRTDGAAVALDPAPPNFNDTYRVRGPM